MAELMAFASAIRAAQGRARHRLQRDGQKLYVRHDGMHMTNMPAVTIMIHHVLDQMGTPLKLLCILSLVLERGATFIRVAEDEVFGTSHGVKQGCPMCCFLFVLAFDIPLRYLSHHGVVFSAYVDDISSPAPPYCQSNACLPCPASAELDRMPT